MPRVIHFEIPADNPARAAKFYTEVFGWQINKWEGPIEYWLVTTGDSAAPGINGGLVARQHKEQSTVNTVDVPSVDDFVAKVQQNGGVVVVPKMPIPGVGWLAYCQDPEGNIFGIMQNNPKAG